MLFSVLLTLSYGAFVAFYHANPSRAHHAVVQRLGRERLGWLRSGGWAVLGLTLLGCVVATDLARGIAIWLGILSITAAASLICSVLRPTWHLRSIFAVAALSLASVVLDHLLAG